MADKTPKNMNLTNYKHIIWDWNGTLLNDLWLCLESVNAALARRGLAGLTEKQYQDEFDFPVIDFYRKVGFDFDKESFADLAHEYHAVYEPRWSECDLQIGARDALEWLSAAGIGQSLLSAAHQSMLDACVKHFKLGPFFMAVLGARCNQAHGKVDEGRGWMEKLDCGPHDVLLVGDTTHDAEVARAIGADCVLIESGHHRRDKLETCGVEVCDSLADLLSERSNGSYHRVDHG